MKPNYLVITNRPCENAEYFGSPEELNLELEAMPEITILIFAFWSWIVPKSILSKYKCYGLHTGPLLEGKGRGGSPIDNLKRLDVKITTLCAFEMDEGIDTGKVKLAIPVYLTCDKDLIVYRIDQMLPIISAYLTAKQPDIPEVFKRIHG